MSTHPYVRWTKRLSEVDSLEDRRALMSEVAVHRARSLGNLIEVREATWALSQLHAAVGEHDKAVLEARSLLSLAGGTPPASDEEMESARGWLSSLGVTDLPQIRTSARDEGRRRKSKGRTERGHPGSVKRSSSGPGFLRQARAAGLASQFSEALRLLKGKKGGAVDAVRSWLLLGQALDESAEDRDRLLMDLERFLRKRAEVPEGVSAEERGGNPDSVRPPKKPDMVPDDGPLGAMFGGRLPTRRESVIRVVDAHVAEHPESIDEMAAAALRHHVQRTGERRVAPWWIGLVGRAMCAGTHEATANAIEELGGAYAVTAYSEDGFKFLVGVGRSAVERGWQVRTLRRGLLKKGEPGDVRMWTLTLVDDQGCERILVHGPHSETPSGDASRVGRSIHRGRNLGTVVGFQATGVGHAELRGQASQAGHGGWESTDPGELLDALGALQPHEIKKTEEKKVRSQATDELRGLLADPASWDALRLEEAVGRVRRRQEVCRVVREALPGLDDGPVVSTAQAMLAAWPDASRLPELTTLLLSAAAHGGSACRELLTSPAQTARLGGVGLEALIDLASIPVGEGWEVVRVLSGVTRRERETDPILAPSADALAGLWRLDLRRGENRGDVWYLEDLPVEGRAGFAQMLLKPGQRLMVLPAEGSLTEWYGTLEAPAALSWSGTEAASLIEAIGGWGPLSKGHA